MMHFEHAPELIIEGHWRICVGRHSHASLTEPVAELQKGNSESAAGPDSRTEEEEKEKKDILVYSSIQHLDPNQVQHVHNPNSLRSVRIFSPSDVTIGESRTKISCNGRTNSWPINVVRGAHARVRGKEYPRKANERTRYCF